MNSKDKPRLGKAPIGKPGQGLGQDHATKEKHSLSNIKINPGLTLTSLHLEGLLAQNPMATKQNFNNNRDHRKLGKPMIITKKHSTVQFKPIVQSQELYKPSIGIFGNGPATQKRREPVVLDSVQAKVNLTEAFDEAFKGPAEDKQTKMKGNIADSLTNSKITHHVTISHEFGNKRKLTEILMKTGEGRGEDVGFIPPASIASIGSPNRIVPAHPSMIRTGFLDLNTPSGDRFPKPRLGTGKKPMRDEAIENGDNSELTRRTRQNPYFLKSDDKPPEEKINEAPLVETEWEAVRLPVTPAQVLASHFVNKLTEYEKREISNFLEIYCIGHTANRKRTTADSEYNNGYNDDKGVYFCPLHDHINYRYEILDLLGKGSFGQVYRAMDHKTKEFVALKVIRNKDKFHRQAKVEQSILAQINKLSCHESSALISMKETFTFRNHVIITFELLGMNLYEYMKANKFQGCSMSFIKKIAVQVLHGLMIMRKNKIIHCDLKPENILLKPGGGNEIKLIDFGSACLENEKMYTYIQSRYYRSPEVILGFSYDMAIDMWSLGCILFELYTGYPLCPGENEKDQIQRIMEVLGKPDDHIINTAPRRSHFFSETGEPIITPDRKGRKHLPNARPLMEILQCDDHLFLDFIKKCLNWYPTRRLKPEDGLQHEWLAGVLMSGPKQNIQQPALKTNNSVNSLKDSITNDLLAKSPQAQNSSDKIKSFKIKANNQIQTNSYYRIANPGPETMVASNSDVNISRPLRNLSNDRSGVLNGTKFFGESDPQKPLHIKALINSPPSPKQQESYEPDELKS